MLPSDRFNFSDEEGKKALSKQELELKLRDKFRWATDWQVEVTDKTDKDGWSYAVGKIAELAAFGIYNQLSTT